MVRSFLLPLTPTLRPLLTSGSVLWLQPIPPHHLHHHLRRTIVRILVMGYLSTWSFCGARMMFGQFFLWSGLNLENTFKSFMELLVKSKSQTAVYIDIIVMYQMIERILWLYCKLKAFSKKGPVKSTTFWSLLSHSFGFKNGAKNT